MMRFARAESSQSVSRPDPLRLNRLRLKNRRMQPVVKRLWRI